MKFLIIDDNGKSRAKLQELLATHWPKADIELRNPVSDGMPEPSTDWQSYSLLLLDYDMKVVNGLEWFEQARTVPHFPPTILLSTVADPDIAVSAIKAGAENYLPKRGLKAEKLRETVVESLGHAAHRQDRVMHVTKSQNKMPVPEIEGYKILQKIGQGGMSTIYLAERESDNTQVVIKTLILALSENKKTVLRSHQEFKLISRIQNRHIVKLYDHGTAGELLYTTMEYFPKGDLKQRLRKGMLQKHALKYLRQIAEGLSAIHGCGIIHRDLKPGNIMFRDDDSLAIIDFGISKDINSQLDLTEMGQIMGTPNYMAPEQGNNSYRPDARSDLYSLGVMLYEMLTGNKPYAAPTGAAIIYKHLHDPLPQLPNRFYDMQILIDTLMAKFPQDRIQSAYELLQLIDQEFRLDLALDFE